MWEQVKQALVQSTLRFLTRFASMLPGLAALILAVLVSIAIALILAFVVKRLLIRMRFGEKLVQWGFSSLAKSSAQAPALVVSRTIAGLVILAGFLIGITAFDSEYFGSRAGLPGRCDRGSLYWPQRADRSGQHESPVRAITEHGREMARSRARVGDGSRAPQNCSSSC
jgi:hypothetical protein